jgi:putative ABC transport system permease protein
VAALARDVPVYGEATLVERMSRSVASRTFLMFLLGLFAVTTLTIAAIGLYGVVAQAVAARQREFGIRVALGAGKTDISWLVMRRGLACVIPGVVAGLAATALLGTALRSQLYDTRPANPGTLAMAVVVLLVVALLAHAVPLLRATRLDPVAMLKEN